MSPTSCDPFGDHQIACHGNSDRIAWHNSIKDIHFEATQAAALASTREANTLVPNSLSWPADVLILNWYGGQLVAVDDHIISLLQLPTLRNATNTPGYALQIGVKENCHLTSLLADQLA